MNSDLKEEIFSIIKELKRTEKIHLAQCIEENWDKTCLEYSKMLNSYRTTLPMEKIFTEALSQELLRLGYPDKEIVEIISHFENKRILNTYPHITCSGKPRHLFIDYLASLSLNTEDYYGVAMFSGVPFSNKTRPGRICAKNAEINLMPSIMQDELVYRNKIPEKMVEALDNLPEKTKALFPKAKNGQSYSAWALQSSLNLESKFLRCRPVFFDFNEVASNYLLLAIKDRGHPINKILFSKDERDLVINNMGEVVFFYNSVQKGDHQEMENFYLRDGYLESESGRKIYLNKEELEKELKERLCPGMVLSFLIFAFLNRFQCFGSFAQIEYLPFYHGIFSQFDFLKSYNINESPTGALTTGGFKDDIDLHVLDLVLQDRNIAEKTLKKYENTLFGEAILAIKDVLLHQNYSMNLVRK